jgi:hypothetical protein
MGSVSAAKAGLLRLCSGRAAFYGKYAHVQSACLRQYSFLR